MLPMSCDTLVALGNATANGQTLFAKNSDRPANECQPLVQHPRRSRAPGAGLQCQFVEIPQTAVTYRHIGSRPFWCWGYEHGMNEHQVVIGNEALPSLLPEADEPKLIGMELIRLGLERGRSAAEAVELITALVSEYGQGKFANDAGVRTYDNGYIVADPREAYVVETAGHEWAVKRVTRAMGISNVYSVGQNWDECSTVGAQNGSQSGPQSGRFDFAAAYADPKAVTGSGGIRRARSCALLDANANAIDAAAMMGFLSDHGDAATAIPETPTICVHGPADGSGGNTAASMVADLCVDGSRLPVYWCSFYSPCLGLFVPVFLEGELPEILLVGGEMPDPISPWWRFHALSRFVREEPETRWSQVRARWRPLQQELLASAYAVAVEGKRLLDDGQESRAVELLSGYMAEQVERMLGGVDEFLAETGRQPEPV